MKRKKYLWILLAVIGILMLKVPILILGIHINNYLEILNLKTLLVKKIIDNYFFGIFLVVVFAICGIIILLKSKKLRNLNKEEKFHKKIPQKEFGEIITNGEETEKFKKINAKCASESKENLN